jgi:bla regulator protein blaR1
MFIWMVYVIAVSMLLGLAALAAERAARLRRGGTRWFWLAAIVASLLVPTVIASVSIQLPDVVGTTAADKILVLRDATSIPLSPQRWLGASDAQTQDWRSFDPWLKSAWLTVSTLMLLVLVVNGVQLFRRRRAWKRGSMQGATVHVAADVGPAVVGFLAPGIVVPAWLEEAPVREQAAVIAHEKSHMTAGDPQLFTVALCLLVFMPWNVPLWWQLRRLRNAIEVDCDARVLASGHDAVAYGETLISVGEKQSAWIGAVAAMSESPSFLEERITIMMTKPSRWWYVSGTALGCLSLTLVAVAAQVSPPNAGPAAATAAATATTPQQIALDVATLDRFPGFYKLGEAMVLKVTRNATQLSAQLTGQPTLEIYPETSSRFFYKAVQATLEFQGEAMAPATAVVLRQNGNTITLPRIDAGTATQMETNLTARIQTGQPSPGTEAAVRRMIERQQAGQEPEYERMSPMLAKAAREQAPQAKALLASLGRMESITFQGVSQQGWDAYVVKYEKGTLIYRIGLDPNGTIAMLLLQPL